MKQTGKKFAAALLMFACVLAIFALRPLRTQAKASGRIIKWSEFEAYYQQYGDSWLGKYDPIESTDEQGNPKTTYSIAGYGGTVGAYDGSDAPHWLQSDEWRFIFEVGDTFVNDSGKQLQFDTWGTGPNFVLADGASCDVAKTLNEKYNADNNTNWNYAFCSDHIMYQASTIPAGWEYPITIMLGRTDADEETLDQETVNYDTESGMPPAPQKAAQLAQSESASSHSSSAYYEPVYIPSELELLVADVTSKIQNAPANGTLVIDMRDYHILTKSMADAMRARPDLGVQYQFTYQGTAYQLTIAPHTDLTRLPGGSAYEFASEACERGNCEGFFFVASRTGTSVRAR